jgi:pilus assembly protein Flp/PilA
MSFGKKRPEPDAAKERRAASRAPAGLDAKAIFNDTTKDCSVVDLSKRGARIRLQGFAALPDKFELHVPEREISLGATVQWRLNDEVGVVFDGNRSAAPTDFGLVARIEKLEATVARLEQIIMNSGPAGAAEARDGVAGNGAYQLASAPLAPAVPATERGRPRPQALVRAVQCLTADETGATAVEYGLIAALLSVAIAGASLFLGGGLSSTFTYVATQVTAAASN